jgi:hypothetical protein
MLRNKNLTWIGLFAMNWIIIAPMSQVADSHQRQLFTINGKDYLFVLGSFNESLLPTNSIFCILQ